MNSLNSILIEGNLVRDAELTYTPSNTPVCKFSVATNRYFKRNDAAEFEQEVSYFDVVCFGEIAKRVCDKLKKGRGTRVIGRLKQERWQGEDGKGRSRIVIISNHIEFKPEWKKKDPENKPSNSVF